jgi:mRNA-degrading endonuclease toxin of MazEF toxin-antitoxin module
MKRGDVVLVRIPHPTGLRGKKRPAVIVQADSYAGSIRTVVVAEVTKNLEFAKDPACLFISSTSSEGATAGLVRDSVVSCLILYTVYADSIERVIGSLTNDMREQLDKCLKVALDL